MCFRICILLLIIIYRNCAPRFVVVNKKLDEKLVETKGVIIKSGHQTDSDSDLYAKNKKNIQYKITTKTNHRT